MLFATSKETLDDLLGIEAGGGSRNEFALIDALRTGLPRSSLQSVAERIAPNDKSFRFRLVPRATLARKARLSAEHGAKVARLAKVWQAALDAWQDETAARDFLWRPHALLDGMAPVDVTLMSEFGGPLVERILGQLRHGTAV